MIRTSRHPHPSQPFPRSALLSLLAVVACANVAPAQATPGDPLLTLGAHDVDLGEVRLHYVVQGHGAPVFVAAPGWGTGSSYLQKGLAPLEKHRTLVFIDMRGSGGSTRPADRRHMSHDVMADDLDELRKKLGLESIDLLGHSDGGAIAIEYAERHPQQVRKLVLVSTTVLGDPERNTVNATLELWADDPQYREAVQEAKIAFQFGPGLTDEPFQHALIKMLPLYLSDPSRYLGTLKKTLQDMHLSAYAEVAQDEADQQAHRDQAPELQKIQADTLILNGTVDWISPYSVAQRLQTAVPNSHLSLYVNKGHFLWIEAAPRFFAEVGRFLGQ